MRRHQKSRGVSANPTDAARMPGDTRAKLRFRVAPLFASAGLCSSLPRSSCTLKASSVAPRPAGHPSASRGQRTVGEARSTLRQRVPATLCRGWRNADRPRMKSSGFGSTMPRECGSGSTRSPPASSGARRLASQALCVWVSLAHTGGNEYEGVTLVVLQGMHA